MQLPKGIERHGNGWRLRLRVPLDVKAQVGREFIRETIRETDSHRAVTAGLKRLVELHEQWDRIRATGRLTAGIKARIAAEYEADTRTYEAARASTIPSDDVEVAVRRIVDSLDPVDLLSGAGLEILKQTGLAAYETRRKEALLTALDTPAGRHLVAHDAQAAVKSEGLPSAYEELSAALIETHKRALVEPQPEAAHNEGETVLAQFATFEKANPRSIRPDSMARHRARIEHLAATLGPTFRAADLNRAAVNTWCDALAQWPSGIKNVKRFDGLSPAEVIAIARAENLPPIDRLTQNHYLSSGAAFGRWLVTRGVVEHNPFAQRHLKLDSEPTRRPFTKGELTRLFANLPADGWQRWLPLIGRATGARLQEIAGLRTQDVRQEGDGWTIAIVEHPGRRLKNKTSARVIPVHSELIRLGLLELVERQRLAGEAMLFPGINSPSQWFGRLTRSIGLVADGSEGIVFHSFRHTVADELREAGFSNSDVAILLGHAGEGSATTRGYGRIAEGNMKLRVRMVEAISFNEIAHLRPA